jgi:hypothetical protein
MTGEPIMIPPLDHHLTEKERQEVNPANSKYTVLHEGTLLPVMRMYGMDSQRVTNPLHAFFCVAFYEGKWVMMKSEPGNIWPKRSPP